MLKARFGLNPMRPSSAVSSGGGIDLDHSATTRRSLIGRTLPCSRLAARLRPSSIVCLFMRADKS
jgi:hypothetical protein